MSERAENEGGGRLRYMPALDGLRGLAVGGVLAFHGGVLRGGFLGVDLFFVLSGFLITQLLLLEARSTGGIRLGAFWARRVRRLLPALLLVLGAVAAYAAWWAAPTEAPRIRSDAVATLAYVANWRAIFSAQNYWDLFGAPSPLQHSWSLAIEEQFYLVWPPVVAVLVGSSRPAAAVGALAAVLAALSAGALALLYTPSDSARAYYGTDTRACALLLGAVLAAVSAERRPSEGRGRDALEVAASGMAVALAIAWARADGEGAILYRGGLLGCQVAVVVLLLAASHPVPGFFTRALSLAPLRYVGRISYGLYLWHWPVFVALSEPRLGFGGAGLFGLRLAVSVLLAVVSYHLIELPMRSAFRGWRLALVASAAIVAVTGLVLVGTMRGEQRPMPVVPAASPWREPGARERARTSPLRWLIVGDSVAHTLALSAQAIEPELGLSLCNGGVSGCGLFEGEYRYRRPDGRIIRRGRECAPLARWEELVRSCAADHALVLIAPPVLGEWEIDGQWRQACEPAFDHLFEQQMSRGLDALGPVPAFVPTLPYGLGDGWDEAARRRTDCLNQAIQRALLARPTVRSLDLATWVCPGGKCRAQVDGVVLRSDGLHFSGAGAQLVTWWLVDAIRERPR